MLPETQPDHGVAMVRANPYSSPLCPLWGWEDCLRWLQTRACLHSHPVLSVLCLHLCGIYVYSTCKRCPAAAGFPRGTCDLPEVILQPVHGLGSGTTCPTSPSSFPVGCNPDSKFSLQPLHSVGTTVNSKMESNQFTML